MGSNPKAAESRKSLRVDAAIGLELAPDTGGRDSVFLPVVHPVPAHAEPLVGAPLLPLAPPSAVAMLSFPVSTRLLRVTQLVAWSKGAFGASTNVQNTPAERASDVRHSPEEGDLPLGKVAAGMSEERAEVVLRAPAGCTHLRRNAQVSLRRSKTASAQARHITVPRQKNF